MRPSVAIIGGGLSGLLTALHVVSDPDGPKVSLIERGSVFGRGAAYATANPDHLLNVRVGNMSAFPDQPDHFTLWLAGQEGWSAQDGFVTRKVYGDYLQDLLRKAVTGGEAGRLLLEPDEAVDVERTSGGWRVRLALGRSVDVDAVVLAVGVMRPEPPAGAAPDLLASSRYLADPWTSERPLSESASSVLLIGAGLSMVDAAITMAAPGRRFHAISRRGLLPQTHAAVSPAAVSSPPNGGPLMVLRRVRERALETGDWRAAVDALRPYLTDLWRGWSQREREAFLRHLRPWWDIHRHRMAPSVARRIEGMLQAHDLTVAAGEVRRLNLRLDGVEVIWRPRGLMLTRRLHVDAVVNCTGVAGDVERSADPLLGRMMARGWMRADACRLGADVDGGSRLLDAHGRVQPTLFAVGALTRGAFWEITSAPDIRLQAERVARRLIDTLAPTPTG